MWSTFTQLKLIVGAEQQGFLIVAGVQTAVVAGQGWCGDPLLQRGLLGVLLVSWREIVDGILNHVSRVHGLLQAAGNALHGGTATKGIQAFVHVDCVCKRMSQSQSSEEHFNANDEVLVACCNSSLADRHLRRADLRNRSTLLQDGKKHALPEGEKDDGFDHEELEHGPVGAEQVSSGEVEQEESVERQADGDVVNDGHIEVTAGNIEVSITIFAKSLQDDCNYGHQGFYHTEL